MYSSPKEIFVVLSDMAFELGISNYVTMIIF